MPNEGRRGGFGSPGSRVFSNENIQSELVSPILSGCAICVLSGIIVGLLVFDSLVLGPSLWGIGGALLIAGIGTVIAVRAYRVDGDWCWITAGITIAVIACIVLWSIFGIEWLRRIWPKTKLVRRINSISNWWKLIIQAPIAAIIAPCVWVIIRQRIEILDPGWSRRFEREAQFVGAKPNWPMRGSQFPSQELEARIEDLEIALEESKIERRLVQVEVTNGDEKTVNYAELPDDDNARKFYWLVSTGASFSVQTAIKAKCRAEFESTIRPSFLDRKWAFWIDPQKPRAGMKLGAAGRAVMRYLALPHPETV